MFVVTDHGGEGTSHSGATPPMQTIPIGAVGPSELSLPEDPTHMDTAPTVLDWMGVAERERDGVSWLR